MLPYPCLQTNQLPAKKRSLTVLKKACGSVDIQVSNFRFLLLIIFNVQPAEA